MALPLNTLTLVGSALVWGVGALQKRKEKRDQEAAARAPVQPPMFEEESIREFTEKRGASRCFQPDIATGLVSLLESRSLSPIPPTSLSADPEEVRALARLGTFYAVEPGSETLASAGHVLRECQKSGAVVVGSLSLVLLPSGADYPMIVGVGGRSLAEAANESGEFALLLGEHAPEAKSETETTAEANPPSLSPEAESVPAVASANVVPLNGASYSAEIIGSIDSAILLHDEGS